MPRRNLLRRQLYEAWCTTIREHYEKQRINSERGLQVFFCAALLALHDKEGLPRRIFVEPRLTTSNGVGGPYPDIVICNSTQIIGIVQLKYVPRARAKTKKDLQTLYWVAKQTKYLSICNTRYLGVDNDSHQYSLAADAVLCWAGVHRGVDSPLRSRVAPAIQPYFMELHALTAPNVVPRVKSNYRPKQ